MKRMYLFILSPFLIIVMPFLDLSASAHRAPDPLFESYVEAVEAGDWEAAEKCWLPEEVEKSKRLEITYQGVKAKYDCSSPLISLQAEISNGRVEVEIGKLEISDTLAVFDILLLAGGDTITVKYYALEKDAEWFLVYPMTALASGWDRLQTEYADIFYSDKSMINDYAVDGLDDYIEFLIEFFELNPDKIDRLRTEKIDYYLCTKEDFKNITGYDAHGLAYLSADAIITRHLPHPHELTHLIINYTLDSVPLYTLPFLQEGLACMCGGRWGKSPEVINQLGSAILKNDLCNLDDILTLQGFNVTVGMPDISYPVSSLFSGYLVEEMGIQDFKRLYLELSGSSEEVDDYSKEYVISKIWALSGLPFDSIRVGFLEYSAMHEGGGIFVYEDNPDAVSIQELTSDSLEIEISESLDCYNFIIGGVKDKLDGTILLFDDSIRLPDQYQSWMFAEQLPEHEYDGAVCGIKFDINEAGFYDYRTNILEAKFVSSFFPEAPYYDPVNKTVKFSLRKPLIPKSLESYKIILSD
ncbi:MAG TPA: hypothetical protein ENO22_03835 [candidate division Zixibacteria bacterium]|nr:hypothetical protein [candidate division Zixibacteria bacterium]HEQ98455.1 hypothetical protein [candidate division Zixibacteria bacterium]